MTRLLAIDPGSTHSAYVLYNTRSERIGAHGHVENQEMRRIVKALHLSRVIGNRGAIDHMAFERVRGYGNRSRAGNSVLDTAEWGGRFIECFGGDEYCTGMPRSTVRGHLLSGMNVSSGDAQIRKVLKERFGDAVKGFNNHEFAALAVAVTWAKKYSDSPEDRDGRG